MPLNVSRVTEFSSNTDASNYRATGGIGNLLDYRYVAFVATGLTGAAVPPDYLSFRDDLGDTFRINVVDSVTSGNGNFNLAILSGVGIGRNSPAGYDIRYPKVVGHSSMVLFQVPPVNGLAPTLRQTATLWQNTGTGVTLPNAPLASSALLGASQQSVATPTVNPGVGYTAGGTRRTNLTSPVTQFHTEYDVTAEDGFVDWGNLVAGVRMFAGIEIGDPTPTGPTVKYWNGTSEVAATLSYWDGTSEVPLTIDQITP